MVLGRKHDKDMCPSNFTVWYIYVPEFKFWKEILPRAQNNKKKVKTAGMTLLIP